MVFSIRPRSPPYAAHPTLASNCLDVLLGPNDPANACSPGTDADTTSKTSRCVYPSPTQRLEALLDTPPEETRRRRSWSAGSASQPRPRHRASSSSMSSAQQGSSSTTPRAETASKDSAQVIKTNPSPAASSAKPGAWSSRFGGPSPSSYMGSVFAGPSSSSITLPPLEEEDPSPWSSSLQLDPSSTVHSAHPDSSSSQPSAPPPSWSRSPAGEGSSSSSTVIPPRLVPPSPGTRHLPPASSPPVGPLSNTAAPAPIQRPRLPSGPSIIPPVPPSRLPIRHRRSVSFDLNPEHRASSSMSSRGRLTMYSLGNTPGPVRYPKPATLLRAPSPEKKSPYPASSCSVFYWLRTYC